MNHRIIRFASLLLCAVWVTSTWSPCVTANEPATETEQNPHTVATFECIGIYYKTADAGVCKVRYKTEQEKTWRKGLDLVYDARDGEYRGSLVGLKAGTVYTIQLECRPGTPQLRAATRSERLPIGKTTYLPGGETNQGIEITQPGTPDAYHLVTPGEGEKTTIDVRNGADYTVVVDANYVILRGVELKNAAIHGVLIRKGRHHIVIEDCRIASWGRCGGPISFGNAGCIDSAIYAERDAGNLVVQRNLIVNPRGASNDWTTGHPNGPQGISLINSSGGNIIRYNEIRSSEDHGYNDGIGGGSNFSAAGSPNRDSDIYGNIIQNVWDDAIESEGANMNVRIWGNYIDLSYQFIATAATAKGPLYIFRNVWHRSRRTHQDSLGGGMIKVGGRGEFRGGRRFIFHNTALQPGGAFDVISNGAVPNCETRNNVFDCRGKFVSSHPADPTSDFDYDFFSGMDRGAAREKHGVSLHWNQGGFAKSYKLEFYPSATVTRMQWGKVPMSVAGKRRDVTDPVVSVPNPIIDAGAIIPGFNDDFAGKGPDLGAFELGRPPLKFGRRAGQTVWAPWELR